VYVTGRARDALGTMDVLVAKLDVTNGATMWTRTYDGPSLANDMGTALVVDDTGNVVATGQSWGPGEYDYVTLKYASDGTPRWTMRYDGPGDIADVPAAVKLDAAYSVYVTGYSNSNSGWEDFATVKYSQTGTQRWVARYNTGSSLDDNARAMQIVGPYVYVTGFGESSNNDFDFVTVKYDTAGAQLWVARYNYDPEDDEDVSSGIAVTGPGVFYVTGHSYGGVATAFDYLTLKYFESDLAAVAVVAPTGTMPPQPVVPQVRVRNNGTAAASGTAYLRVLLGTTQLYADTQDVVGVPGADSVDVAFKPFVGGEGDYAARCSVVLAGDQDHSNDTTSGLFSLRYTTLPFWTEMPTVMLGPAMKFVKDGGGLCFGRYTETRNAVFCLRGNGTNEFLRYQLSGDSWHLCESLPYAPDANKRVKKGGAVTFALRDDTAAYAFKGANTLEFWRYDALRDSWSQRQNLLEGPRGKRIKGGAALAYYRNSSTEDRYIFALKGAKTNEFYAFHVQSQAWSARDTVPMGPRYKGMADGSALVNAGGTLYALKGGLNELYAYDIDADSWYARTPLPMYGASGRSRKAKYGSALAYGDGVVYCLKGGSREFWAYHPDADAWVELESLPLPPSLKKAVKGGGALTFGSDRIWAIKGNKTLDFYAYTPGTFGDKAEPGQVRRDGVMARQSTIADCRLTVAPNPLARGFATLRYTLPRAGAVSLGITDVTGRQVMTRTLTAGRTGTLTLDLRQLSAGVYLVKVTGDSYTVSQKLVVER
jgi:hypothetical protein